MPILYSVIACENKISAKYSSCNGNFTEIAEEVLKRISSRNEKMTYSHGQYLFHYINDGRNFYFCITDKSCQRSRAFFFLNQIRIRFMTRNKDFDSVLAEEMYRYSLDCNTITIKKGELEELNNIGVGSSESILGEKILFVNNSGNLRYQTVYEVKEIPHTPLSNNIDGQSYASKEERKPKLIFVIFFIVILILVWLVLSVIKPVSLVPVACICALCVIKLSRCKNNLI